MVEKKQALICVDDADQAESFERILREFGFEPAIADNFDKALDLAIKKKFDVALAGGAFFGGSKLRGRETTPVGLLNMVEKTNPRMRLIAFTATEGGRFSHFKDYLIARKIDVISGAYPSALTSQLKAIFSEPKKSVDWRALLKPLEHLGGRGVNEYTFLELEDLEASGRLQEALEKATMLRQGWRSKTSRAYFRGKTKHSLKNCSVPFGAQPGTIFAIQEQWEKSAVRKLGENRRVPKRRLK